ncbi:hypothetical protein UlMin_001789 [Ulmus minor]
MTESLPEIDINDENSASRFPEIPIDIVSEEEMALLEAALVSARSSFSSSAISTLPSPRFHGHVRCVNSITALSKRGFPGFTEPDMEDLGTSTQKKIRLPLPESFLQRFRKKKGLSVTDITSTEWCEKQMEFVLLGKRRINKAMRKGSARHAKLEEEVIKKVKVRVRSAEDIWALKLLNFIIGVNQLLFEGLTRELPLISFVEGVWMVGVIDEVRMPVTETDKNPLLVDTKTRVRSTLPAEPQQRNGRLQLMCYKHMWDSLAAEQFPANKFFDFFSLNPYHNLSEEIIESYVQSGFSAKTLDDVVRYYVNTCSILPSAQEQLLLRYESQQDNSLLGEDQFAYDLAWLQNQIHGCLEFWRGQREANYTPEEERWKCRYCQYASICPTNANLDVSTSGSSPTNSTPDNTTSS